jgi:hypothetical protein
VPLSDWATVLPRHGFPHFLPQPRWRSCILGGTPTPSCPLFSPIPHQRSEALAAYQV